MGSQLVIIHRPGGDAAVRAAKNKAGRRSSGVGSPTNSSASGSASNSTSTSTPAESAKPLPLQHVWKTCLRQIAFVDPTSSEADFALEAGDEKLAGEAAYAFLLSVICGLRSPVVGETEIMGQFREFLVNAGLSEGSWGRDILRIGRLILADGKTVRATHLKGLGSQSYGSLARRHLRGFERAVFLGAGQLVKEMVPWLSETPKISVVARRPEAVESLKPLHAGLSAAHVSVALDVALESSANSSKKSSAEAALIIAAPMASREIQQWISRQSISFSRILDFRGDSSSDCLETTPPAVPLSEMFRELESYRQSMSESAVSAEKEIARLTVDAFRRAEFRPFGWDDLCA